MVTIEDNDVGIFDDMISLGNYKVNAVNPDTGYNATFNLTIIKYITQCFMMKGVFLVMIATLIWWVNL